MTQNVKYEADRYLPKVYPGEEPFWDGFKAHEIRLQVCDRCGRAWFPIGPVCPFCLSDEFTWKPMSGRGHVSTFVIFHKAWAPWLESRVPYAVVQVELEEGPRLTTNLMKVPAAETKIGMAVQACYEQVSDDVVLLQFEPAESSDAVDHG